MVAEGFLINSTGRYYYHLYRKVYTFLIFEELDSIKYKFYIIIKFMEKKNAFKNISVCIYIYIYIYIYICI